MALESGSAQRACSTSVTRFSDMRTTSCGRSTASGTVAGPTTMRYSVRAAGAMPGSAVALSV